MLREVVAADPAVILVDLDTDETLRLLESLGRSTRPYASSYVDGLLHDEVARRFAKGRHGEHPLVAAARHARAHQVMFIPMRPITRDPGWLARRRGRQAARVLPDELDPVAFADAFARVLGRLKVWHAQVDVERAQPRVHRTLLDGRAPVLALVQAHRVAPFIESLRTLGRIPA